MQMMPRLKLELVDVALFLLQEEIVNKATGALRRLWNLLRNELKLFQMFLVDYIFLS